MPLVIYTGPVYVKLIADVLVAFLVKNEGGMLEEFLFPVPHQVRLDVVFGGKLVDLLFTLDGFKNDFCFLLWRKGTLNTGHDGMNLLAFLAGLSISDSLYRVQETVLIYGTIILNHSSVNHDKNTKR